MNIHLHHSYKGIYILQVMKGGKVTRQYWAENLITDIGLDMLGGTESFLKQCFLGTGTTPPSPGDTQLESLLASSDIQDGTGEGSTSTEGTERYYRYLDTFTFSAGSIMEPVTEMGCGMDATHLFSRALLLDGEGNPTKLEILPDESLQVIYQLQGFMPPGDTMGILTSTYNIQAEPEYIPVTIRIASINSYMPIHKGISQDGSLLLNTYSGPIQGESTIPSGQSTGTREMDITPYITGSHELSISHTYDYNHANWPEGINALSLQCNQAYYQIGLGTPIMKGDRDYITIKFTISWGRYDP